MVSFSPQGFAHFQALQKQEDYTHARMHPSSAPTTVASGISAHKQVKLRADHTQEMLQHIEKVVPRLRGLSDEARESLKSRLVKVGLDAVRDGIRVSQLQPGTVATTWKRAIAAAVRPVLVQSAEQDDTQDQ